MDEFVQYLIHPAIRDALDDWLGQRGVDMIRVPGTDEEDDLPTYFMSPRNLR